jgi:asparagine synthase (glutamine-hydrolysing)
MYVSIYLLFREIRQHSTVALSGESADEVFGGYPWYHVPAMLNAPMYPWAPGGSWAPLLLDRKDRLSMASGLEVRVPFCDHRLVDYVWNVPWAMKSTGGIEKGLLRTAAAGLLPEDLLGRRKSAYPGAADTAYDKAIGSQMRRLLGQPDAPLFSLVSREKLTAVYAENPLLPGTMGIGPSRMAPAAFLLDVNRWLERSGVRIR